MSLFLIVTFTLTVTPLVKPWSNRKRKKVRLKGYANPFDKTALKDLLDLHEITGVVIVEIH
jgi:hypothetical protein